jgi:hypothetical protein
MSYEYDIRLEDCPGAVQGCQAKCCPDMHWRLSDQGSLGAKASKRQKKEPNCQLCGIMSHCSASLEINSANQGLKHNKFSKLIFLLYNFKQLIGWCPLAFASH